jgi:hypothetical protein
MKLGVDLAISSSSSFISAAILAKSGVLRYRSPVSGSIATNTEPSGAFFAVSTAAHMVAPPEIPVRMPSFRAMRLAAPGSARIIFVPGLFSLMYLPAPWKVPPVPIKREEIRSLNWTMELNEWIKRYLQSTHHIR